ncbi:hypothetical protein DY000_02042944 [Brassica cretica]|uniref:NAF domain-containing protein n=1 Tax=Brassica cretica TaxID=69181 RepID=A0ABQ7BFC7_BRACR|nr:hypothetical protein DY000_02042944 [Brassica cretica]
MAIKPNGKSPITSEDLSCRYFHQLISAVGYCHSRGVFHRDLKFHIISGSPGFNLSGMFSGEYDRVERFVSTAARVLQHRSYGLLDSCNESFFQFLMMRYSRKHLASHSLLPIQTNQLRHSKRDMSCMECEDGARDVCWGGSLNLEDMLNAASPDLLSPDRDILCGFFFLSNFYDSSIGKITKLKKKITAAASAFTSVFDKKEMQQQGPKSRGSTALPLRLYLFVFLA